MTISRATQQDLQFTYCDCLDIRGVGWQVLSFSQ